MAEGYSTQPFVIGSRFNPLDLDTLNKALAPSEAAYNTAQQNYTDLAVSSDILQSRAEQDPTSDWAHRYNDYRNALNNASKELAVKGLYNGLADTVMDLKRRYAQDITPIAAAISKLTEKAKIRASTNPADRIVFSDMPTVDQLIADPEHVDVKYSGADVYKQAYNASKAESARMDKTVFFRDPTFRNYIHELRKRGFEGSGIDTIMEMPVFEELFNNIENQFKRFEGLNHRNHALMRREILNGLIDGIMYEENHRLSAIPQYNYGIKGEKEKEKEQKPREFLRLTPNRLYVSASDDVISALEKNKKALSDYNKIIISDLTSDTYIPNPAVRDGTDKEGKKSFSNLLSSELRRQYAEGDETNAGLWSALIDKYKELNDHTHDTMSYTEYDFLIDESEKPYWNDIVNNGFGNSNWQKARFDRNYKTYIKEPDQSRTSIQGTKNSGVFTNNPLTITKVSISPYGLVGTFRDDKGNTSRYYLDPQNNINWSNAWEAMKAHEQLSKLYIDAENKNNTTVSLNTKQQETLKKLKETNPELFKEDIPDSVNLTVLKEVMKQLLNNVAWHLAQTTARTDTKQQTVNSIGQ